jgi:hypothetical protein
MRTDILIGDHPAALAHDEERPAIGIVIETEAAAAGLGDLVESESRRSRASALTP